MIIARKVIAWDVETHLVRQGCVAPKLVCLSTAGIDGSMRQLYDAKDGLAWFQWAISDPDVVLVGHNVTFDLLVMCAEDERLVPYVFRAIDAGRVRCTMLRERLLDLAQGKLMSGKAGATRYSLDAIAGRRLDMKLDKGEDGWRLRYAELDGIPIAEWPERAVLYAKMDAVVTLALHDAQQTTANTGRTEPRWDAIPDEVALMRATWALALMTAWGVRTDPARVAEYKATLKKDLEAIAAEARAAGLVREDGTRDTAMIQGRLAEALAAQGKSVTFTATRGVSIAGEYLKAAGKACDTWPECRHTMRCEPSEDAPDGCEGDPLLVQMAEYDKLTKLLGTYVPKLELAAKHPLNPRYTSLLETGRTSATDNAQTPPRKGGVRGTFVPREGWVYAGADYDGAEMRSWAQVCLDLVGHSKLAALYQANPDADPHCSMGAILLGVPEEEFVQRYKADDPIAKEYRQQSKPCFHPDTETLTRSGWKRIADLETDDEVLQAIPIDGDGVRLEWAIPTVVYTRRYDGEMVHLHNEGIDLRVTPEHRMLVRRQDGRYAVTDPEKVPSARGWANAGQLHGEKTVEIDLLRLAVATQADGSFVKHQGQIRLGFVKKRKIRRMRSLLSAFDTALWYMRERGGVTTFVVRTALASRVKALLDGKKLPWWWLDLTPSLRKSVVSEARWWDGTAGVGRRGYDYCSVERQNADVLQAIAASVGQKSSLRNLGRQEKHHRDVYKVSIKVQDGSRGGNLRCRRVPSSGVVACLSVPSSFVLVRDGGVPVVVGQCNFGFPGGMGEPTMIEYAAGQGIKLTPQRAKQARDAWRKAWPENWDYFKLIGAITSGPGKVGTIKQLRSGRIRGGVMFTQAANGFFQALTADGAKRSLWYVSWECYVGTHYNDDATPSPLAGCRPVMFLHDEIIAEMREEVAHVAAPRMAELMVIGMREFLPDVPVRAAPVLSRRWVKGAKAKFDAEGRLIPFEDAQKPAQARAA